MEIRMEVTLTEGYQQRFTSACLAQLRSRKEVTNTTYKNTQLAERLHDRTDARRLPGCRTITL